MHDIVEPHYIQDSDDVKDVETGHCKDTKWWQLDRTKWKFKICLMHKHTV